MPGSNSILSSFNAGLSGIQANRRALEIVGANIANVNTEGYTKQRVEFAPNSGGGIGSGVSVYSIIRDFNRFTENQLTSATEKLGTLNQEKKFMEYIEDVFQESEDTGLSYNMNNFFNAFSAMSSNPGNLNERYNLVMQAQRVGGEFARIDKWLRDLQQDSNKEISAMVDEVNLQITSLRDLNERISRFKGTATSINELLDQRESTVRKISAIVDTQVIESENDFQLLVGGMSVVSNNEASLLKVQLIDDNSANLRVFLTSGNGSGIDISDRLTDGKIRGALDIRDKYIPDYLDRLNDLAFNLVQEVNALHQTGFGLDGITGRLFFNDIADTEDDRSVAAANIGINPQILDNPIRIAAADNPGEIPYNNKTAVAIADLANKAIIGLNNQTFVSNYGTLLERIGLDARGIYTDQTIQNDFQTQLQIRRQGESGVSIDEEATKLIIYQKAFEGAARVINVASELLEIIVNLG